MKRHITLIALLALLAFIGVGATKCGEKVDGIHRALDDLGIPKSKSNFKTGYVTPKGIKVMSTVPVPATALEDIDTGISELLARYPAKYPNWTKFLKHSDYSVIIIDPMGVSVESLPGAPLIAVKGVTTAGTAIGKTKNSHPLLHIVVPHQQGQDWRFRDYFMRSVWHEGEHVFESQNDLNVFFQYTGANDVHPHAP